MHYKGARTLANLRGTLRPHRYCCRTLNSAWCLFWSDHCQKQSLLTKCVLRFQVYGSHPFSDSTIPSQHSFDSTQSAFGSDVTQLGGNPQQILGIQAGQGYVESSQGSPMPGSHPSDLPVVLNRPDLQWLVTTSNVDIRTLTPPNTVSSPHVGMPPRYHAQPGSPSTQPVGHHMMDDRSTSSATISHHHILPRYQNASERPTQSTAAKRGTTVAGQTKPKGTPGRKRKVPDHEVCVTLRRLNSRLLLSQEILITYVF